MSSRRISYIIMPVILLLMLVAVFRNTISADSDALGKLISKKNLTISIENKKTIFTLLKYKNGDHFDFVLEKRNMIGGGKTIKLIGFENDANLCQDKSIKLANNNGDAVCLAGDVGAHSQNIQLIKYLNGQLLNIKITNGDSLGDNISSDVPHYSFTDRNNDSFLDLTVDQRNYDADPLTGAFRSYYINAGSEFVFDGKENITYNKD